MVLAGGDELFSPPHHPDVGVGGAGLLRGGERGGDELVEERLEEEPPRIGQLGEGEKAHGRVSGEELTAGELHGRPT